MSLTFQISMTVKITLATMVELVKMESLPIDVCVHPALLDMIARKVG